VTAAGHLEQIWRYPAKTMLGERLDLTELTEAGVLGDRWWAIRDEVRGGQGSKKLPGLMQLSARYVTEPERGAPPPPIEIRLPNGTVTSSERTDVAVQLSEAVDHPVTLWPLQPPTDLDHYRRGTADHDDVMVELREFFGRTDAEPLPDVSWMPPELFEFESLPGTYFDALPIHLITTSSLRRLGELAPNSTIDVRRFRPNLVIDTDELSREADWIEQDWIGRRLHVGGAQIEIAGPCPRCVMTTRAVGELGTDREVLRRIVADANQNFGVYATVTQAGSIRIGDEVRLT